jgi:hypothetical protein
MYNKHTPQRKMYTYQLIKMNQIETEYFVLQSLDRMYGYFAQSFKKAMSWHGGDE